MTGVLALRKEAEGLGNVQSGEEAALVVLNIYVGDMKKMGPDSSPWYLSEGWQTGLNLNKSGSN